MTPHPLRKVVPHTMPAWVQFGTPFFITLCCAERGINQLCLDTVADRLLRCAKFYHEKSDWHCRLFLLMPDHIHAMASFPPAHGMRNFLRKFKIYTARECSVRWQRDFFDHRPRNANELHLKMDYVRQNPVRAGLVTTAADWKYFWEPDTADRLV